MRRETYFLRIILGLSGVILLLHSCSNDKGTGEGTSADTIVVKTPVLIRQVSHDTYSYTQGLLFYNGLLYESNGLYCCSNLRVLDPQTGSLKKNIDIPGSNYFAEGIAIRNGQLIQLTWRARKAFIYSLPNLLKVGEFGYDGDGWGLTADSTSFIMSNGSDTLYYRDDSFNITLKLPIAARGSPLTKLNELEYANGKIYANVLYNDSIYVISPTTGEVMAKIDCTNLKNIAMPIHDDDVLNGIAYDSSTGHFYLTGKRWRYIFEVVIPGE